MPARTDGRLGPRGLAPPPGSPGPGPVITPRRGRRGGRRAARRRRPVDRPGARVHRPGRRRAHRAGAGRRPARLDPGQRRRLRRPSSARSIDKLQAKQRRARPRSPRRSAPGSPALEVGGLLGFLAVKVLGQFDPFYDPARRRRRAGCCWSRPTSCTSSASSASTRTDFRLWVCLHEETHRVQFTAVPWMRDHLRGEIEHLVGAVDLDPAGSPRCSATAVERVGDVVRGDGRRQPARPVLHARAAGGHGPGHRR